MQIYDQDSGVWSQGPDMIYHRTQQQGVALPSGRILMVGGLGGKSPLPNDTCLLYRNDCLYCLPCLLLKQYATVEAVQRKVG